MNRLRFVIVLLVVVFMSLAFPALVAFAQDTTPREVPPDIANNPVFILSVALAGFAELFKPWLKRAGMNEESWTYAGAVWLIVGIAGINSAAVFKINLLPESLNLPPTLGYVATGLVASFGSEIAHRVLDFIRAMTLYAENKAAAA